MKHTTYSCDIEGKQHKGKVKKKIKVPAMFDHDQEDRKSKTEPYFELLEIDICEGCFAKMTSEKRLIYVHGAMGHNTYIL